MLPIEEGGEAHLFPFQVPPGDPREKKFCSSCSAKLLLWAEIRGDTLLRNVPVVCLAAKGKKKRGAIPFGGVGERSPPSGARIREVLSSRVSNLAERDADRSAKDK